MILLQKMQNSEGESLLTENRLGRNEILYAEDDHSYMCHICAKIYLDSNFY